MTANDVSHGTTGSVARATVEDCAAAVVDVDVDVDIDVEDEVGVTDDAVELDLDFVTGWVDVDLGMDVPAQPAITTRPVNPSPTNHTVRCRRTRPPVPLSPRQGLGVDGQIIEQVGEAPLRLGPPCRDVLGRHLVRFVPLQHPPSHGLAVHLVGPVVDPGRPCRTVHRLER